MPALEDDLAADRRALVLTGQLIGFKVEGFQQRGDVGVMPHQQGDLRRFRLVGDQRVVDILHQRLRHVPRHLR
ncbi:hypothetical protein D3C76_1437960 [compost metagenome]